MFSESPDHMVSTLWKYTCDRRGTLAEHTHSEGPSEDGPSPRSGTSARYGVDGSNEPPPFPKLHWFRSLLKKLLPDARTPSAW
jgi:hypothetical protein